MTPEFSLNVFMGLAGLSVGCLLTGISLGRWLESIRFFKEREAYRQNEEAFEIEREAARRLLADLYRHTGGTHGRQQVRTLAEPDAGLRLRH